jgi:hypothetical protein
MANERVERAERESEYFAAMMQAIATRAKLDDDDIAEIRAKVRAAHEPAGSALAEQEPDQPRLPSSKLSDWEKRLWYELKPKPTRAKKRAARRR